MTIANPYIVYLELYWPDGRKPTQNEIARVNSYDVDVTTTYESQCGWDHNTGGWMPAIMQNISVFETRGAPNLRFDVIDTTEKMAYTTPVLPTVPSGSTVRIVIGKSAEIVNGSDNWSVHGHVLKADNSPVTTGSVKAFDLTVNSYKQLGTTAVIGTTDGSYNISYKTSDFSDNGNSHIDPNLVLRVYDGNENQIVETDILSSVTHDYSYDIKLTDGPEPPQPPGGDGKYLVFGKVTNTLGLPVSDIKICATHLAWTESGIQKCDLNAGTTIKSDKTGKYKIYYEKPTIGTKLSPCSPPIDEINLLVEAIGKDKNDTDIVLGKFGVVINAPKVQEANFVVNRTASITESEYELLDARLTCCLGASKDSTIAQLDANPEYLTFIAKVIEWDEALVKAYVRAQKLIVDIQKVKLLPTLSKDSRFTVSIFTQTLYGLVRMGLGDTIDKLSSVAPDQVFNALFEAINRTIISRNLEQYLNDILDYWRSMLAALMAGSSASGFTPWQQELLQLVFSDKTTIENVVKAYADWVGPFVDFCDSLVKNDIITDQQAENLLFVFDLHTAVDGWMPITKRVYNGKSNSNFEWHTIRDLAKVPIESSTYPTYWISIVASMDRNSEGLLKFPGDVPGSNETEKIRIYATRLHDKFGYEGSQQRFFSALKLDTASLPETDTLKKVSVFLGNHTDFSLEDTNLNQYLASLDQSKEINRLDENAQIKLKAIQRLYRLTSDYKAIQYLLGKDIDSALKIAQTEEDQFIVDNEENVGGLTAAQRIHRTATQYTSEILFNVVKYHQNLNVAGGATAITGAMTLKSLQAAVTAASSSHGGLIRFPDWTTLFGDVNKCACKDCQTVFSPGAYMVDLLQFVEKKLKRNIFERRPDLADIEITCPNTDRMMPYIDLVNETLESVVASPEFDLNYIVNDTETPIDIYDLSSAVSGIEEGLSRIRKAFFHHNYPLSDTMVIHTSVVAMFEWIVEDDAWRFIIRGKEKPSDTASFFAIPTPQTSAASQTLEVFPEHFNPNAYQKLENAVFPFNLPLSLGKEEIGLFLRQRNVFWHEIVEAFTTYANDKLDEGIGALEYLNLTKAEELTILAKERRQTFAYWGFDTADSVTIPNPVRPTESLSGTYLDLLGKVPVFLHRSSLSYQEFLDLLDTRFVHLGAADGDMLTIVPDPSDKECNYYKYTIKNLTDESLRRISVFVRLWRRLGWTMLELDCYLMGFENKLIPSGSGTISLVKRLIDEFHLPPRAVFAWWLPMDTRHTHRHPESLFDSVFLVGDKNRPEYQAMVRISQRECVSADSADLGGGADLRAYLRGALKIRVVDMEILWNKVVDEKKGLNLETVTRMYRITTLAGMLKFSVKEFSEITDFLDDSPFPDSTTDDPDLIREAVLNTHAVIKEIRRVQASKLKVPQIAYLLSNAKLPGDPYAPTASGYDTVARGLTGAAAEITSSFPKLETSDAAALSGLLGKMVPADKLARVLRFIEGPSKVTDPDYDSLGPAKEYLTKYLGAAISEVTITKFITYDAGYSLQQRYIEAYNPLRTYLADQASTLAAINLVADVCSIDKDKADALLNRYLPSPSASKNDKLVVKAIKDWKALLEGGWIENSNNEIVPVIVAKSSGSWRTLIVIPKDGTYTFVASMNGVLADPEANAPMLKLGNEKVDKTTNPSYFTYKTNHKYKAGTILEVLFQFAGAKLTGDKEALVTLCWFADNADAVVIPVSVTVPFRRHPSNTYLDVFEQTPDLYLQVYKAAQLSRILGLDKVELDYLAGSSDYQPLLQGLPLTETDTAVPWTTLGGFIDLVGLHRSVSLTSGTLFELWTQPETVNLSTADIAVLTNWQEDDIKVVRSLWEDLDPPENVVPDWTDSEIWYVLRTCMRIVNRLDLNASQILNLLIKNPPTLSTAFIVRNIYRSRFTPQALAEAFKPYSDKLRQRQRDALVGYLTSNPITVNSSKDPLYFFDSKDLYSYYLIDVDMEPDTLISRIKLALNAIQLFAQRIIWGLEGKYDFSDLEAIKPQWEWMRNYRVWEANRKVFLYPENWLEPELRDDKTPFFKEVEDELLQNEVTDEHGRNVLANYLEKVGEVANPEVIGSFKNPINANGIDYMLHVIARTRSQSHTFFQRNYVAKKVGGGSWTPWVKIELDIKSDVAAPVIFNNRLHLFWLHVKTKQDSKSKRLPEATKVTGDNSAPVRAKYISEIHLMWSEYIPATNKWSKPRVSKGKAMDENVQPAIDRDPGQDEPETFCYHLMNDQPDNEMLTISLIKSLPPASGKMSISSLGQFKVMASGDDIFETKSESFVLGSTWPVCTKFQSNRAVQAHASIDGEPDVKQFRLKSSQAFLTRTSEEYSVFGANFGYLKNSEPSPFFFDTPTKSLFVINKPPLTLGGLTKSQTQVAHFTTFHHPILPQLQGLLRLSGPEGIMNRLTEALPYMENYYYSYINNKATYHYNYYGHLYLGYHIAGDTMAWGSGQRKFELEYQPNTKTVLRPYPMPSIDFNQGTSFGIYNWELFFHVPLLVATRLSQELKFEDAMKWFHYIFDPKQDYNTYEKTKVWALDRPEGCRYWTFLPFFSNKNAIDSLLTTLGYGKQPLSINDKQNLTTLIEEWRNKPFDPHLIARQRIVAYQKNVVMKYLDNLIAWADQLFRQDTFEAINQATQLYILAAEILGNRPEDVEPQLVEHKRTYRELQAKGIDQFSESMGEAEYLMLSHRSDLKDADLPAKTIDLDQFHGLAQQTLYFAVPRNPKLDTYWNTVADRLFKIRNSMNIDGVKRQLALFEPPIDPALLVRAAAAGIDLSSAISQLNRPLPLYRFTIWLQKAMDLCNEVKSFGAALLSALEKQDGEALQLLRQTHEIKMLELAHKVRERQVEEADANIEALERSKELAEERHDEYSSREMINSTETAQMALITASTVLEAVQGATHATAGVVRWVPDLYCGAVGPFPLFMSYPGGGEKASESMKDAGDYIGVAASIIRGLSTITGLLAGYERRWEDWKLQERLALGEIAQIEQQITSATIRRDIAQLELDNHEVQMDQANEIRDFLKEKFTNRELYGWMVQQLSRTFQDIYKLAYDAAKTAEKAFEFELGISVAGFIQFGYMDSLKRGLLTGEKLVYDLKRMEIAYLERNKREFEITKPVSLSILNGEQLQALREKGICTFELPEVIFDLDFPGQYFRRIKSVRLTIPCVTGPYTNVSAKLTLLSSAIRVDAASSEDYSYQGYTDNRFIHDLTGIQSIATSSAQNDAGVFELNFRDERYLPFEGAGVISKWRLELPQEARQFDYDTISDVVMNISYTAREGGEKLKSDAVSKITDELNNILNSVSLQPGTGLVRVISLRKEFPDVLHNLLSSTNVVPMTLRLEHFPYFVRDKKISIVGFGSDNPPNPLVNSLHIQAKPGCTLTTAKLGLDDTNDNEHPVMNSLNSGNKDIFTGTANYSPADFNHSSGLTLYFKQSDLNFENVEDICVIVKYTVSDVIENKGPTQ